MRPGGAGTVKPEKGGGFDLGSLKGPKDTGPSGPTKIGKGVAMPKAPKAPPGLKPPAGPKAPKFK